ncbi:hypothetical protein V6N13_034657 [Hibiscus sabdariffa]
MLISTTQQEKIEEIMEFVVEDDMFIVRVYEVRFLRIVTGKMEAQSGKKDVKESSSEMEESSTDSSEAGDRRKKSISQVDSIVGDVNSAVPSHTIEEIQAKVIVQKGRTNNILGLRGKGLEFQIPKDTCSKRAKKDLSKLGFPPNDFFQSEFQDGRDLGSNSSREDVMLG